ncbi:MAG TPA: hypothetical protein VGB76_15460 [Pyrinomonadaceae bacterium]
MVRKSRGSEIIGAIRKYLIDAAKQPEPITDERLMEVADCARATFYKYVTEGSEIERDIKTARAEQQRYMELKDTSEDEIRLEPSLRERLERAEAGTRELLALFARMTDNLLRLGIPVEIIQAAQREAMTHPKRNFSHAGKGRRGK